MEDLNAWWPTVRALFIMLFTIPLAANYINSYWKIAEKFKDKYEVFGGLV